MGEKIRKGDIHFSSELKTYIWWFIIGFSSAGNHDKCIKTFFFSSLGKPSQGQLEINGLLAAVLENLLKVKFLFLCSFSFPSVSSLEGSISTSSSAFLWEIHFSKAEL